MSSSVLSGASGEGVEDKRTAADITVTKYFGGRTAVSLRGAYSTEDDYESKAFGLTLRHATQDQNTTFTIGFGQSNDEVFPATGPQFTEEKKTKDFIVGLTQVLTPEDVGQVNLYYAQQRGYVADDAVAQWMAAKGITQEPLIHTRATIGSGSYYTKGVAPRPISYLEDDDFGMLTMAIVDGMATCAPEWEMPME